jgi:PAS domain S-box-containing protein
VQGVLNTNNLDQLKRSATAPHLTTLLVVDDDPDVLWSTAKILRDVGFVVLEGAGAADAIRLTQENSPALVLLDVNLPDGNGVDVALQIKKDPALSSVFVVLCSGARISPKDQVDGLRLGLADGYIIRPVGKDELIARIESFLRIRAAQEAVRESENRYRAIYDQSPIAIELYDATGMLIHVNPACLKLFGVENMQVLGGFLLFADPNINDEQKAKLQDRETIHYQGPFDFEKVKTLNLYPTKQEGIIWLDVLITPLVDGAEPISGFLVQIQDITERKRAEENLRESEERFRLITETIDEAFWMANVEIGKIFYISPSFERIWGRSRESLYENPRSFLDAIHVEDRERVLADLEIEKTGQPFDHEYRIILPDNNIRYIWDRGFPIRDEWGQISRYAGVAMDITERKFAEETLIRVNQKLNIISQLTRKELTNHVFVLNSYLELAKRYATGQDRIIDTLQKGEQAIRQIHEAIEYSKVQ